MEKLLSFPNFFVVKPEVLDVRSSSNSLERNTSSQMHHLKRCILHSSVSCIGIFESVCIVPFPTHIEKLSLPLAAARQPQRRFAPQYDGRSDQGKTNERQEPFFLHEMQPKKSEESHSWEEKTACDGREGKK